MRAVVVELDDEAGVPCVTYEWWTIRSPQRRHRNRWVAAMFDDGWKLIDHVDDAAVGRVGL